MSCLQSLGKHVCAIHVQESKPTQSAPASSLSPCKHYFLEQWNPKVCKVVMSSTVHEELLLGLCPAGPQLPVICCQSVQRMVYCTLLA